MDSELSAEARMLIAEARGSDDPTPEDRKRVHAGWLAAIATGAGLSALSETAGAAGSGVGFGAKAALAGLAAAAAGVLALWSDPEPPTEVTPVAVPSASVPSASAPVVAAPSNERPQPNEATAEATERTAAVSGTGELKASDEGDPAAVEVQRDLQAKGEDEPVSEPVQPSRGAPARSEGPATKALAAPPVPAGDSKAEATGAGGQLGEEIAMLSAARQALGRGDATGALSLIRDYDRKFEEPMLTSEARALAVDALCRSGQREAARAAADAFLATWPGSPLSERVRNSCP